MADSSGFLISNLCSTTTDRVFCNVIDSWKILFRKQSTLMKPEGLVKRHQTLSSWIRLNGKDYYCKLQTIVLCLIPRHGGGGGKGAPCTHCFVLKYGELPLATGSHVRRSCPKQPVFKYGGVALSNQFSSTEELPLATSFQVRRSCP